MVPKVPYEGLIDNYFGRIIKLFVTYGMECVFVFDGARNPLKMETNNTREAPIITSRKTLQDIYASHEEVDQSCISSLRKKAMSTDAELYYEIIEYLKRMKQIYLIAPVEADGQLVKLQQQEIVKYILSEDSDLLVLGVTNVIQNLNMDSGHCNLVTNTIFLKALETKYSACSPTET